MAQAAETVLAAERDALVRLALTQRRLAHQYRRKAQDAAKAGQLDWYRHDTREARRLWNDAHWYLGWAMARADHLKLLKSEAA